MKKTLTVLLVVTLLIAGIIFLAGCGESKKGNTIVGSWKVNFYGSDYTYTFNEDGTGKYDVAGTNMEFTYTTDGNKLSILYTGNTEPFETEYSINGNTLNVKDSFGNDTLYERVK